MRLRSHLYVFSVYTIQTYLYSICMAMSVENAHLGARILHYMCKLQHQTSAERWRSTTLYIRFIRRDLPTHIQPRMFGLPYIYTDYIRNTRAHKHSRISIARDFFSEFGTDCIRSTAKISTHSSNKQRAHEIRSR